MLDTLVLHQKAAIDMRIELDLFGKCSSCLEKEITEVLLASQHELKLAVIVGTQESFLPNSSF
jgi:hypothetical protein